jgi:hypothetical protein
MKEKKPRSVLKSGCPNGNHELGLISLNDWSTTQEAAANVVSKLIAAN